MKAKGIWDFDVYDINNDLLQSFKVKNQITLGGSGVFCKALTEDEQIMTPVWRYAGSSKYPDLVRKSWSMVFGTSDAQLSSSNIVLGSQVVEKRSSDVDSSLARAGVEWVYKTRVETYDGNEHTLREAGIYDYSRQILISRVLIDPVIVKTAAVWANVTATIQYV